MSTTEEGANSTESQRVTGVQLLSPTMHDVIVKMNDNKPTRTHSNRRKWSGYDFDGLTVEAVRARQDLAQDRCEDWLYQSLQPEYPSSSSHSRAQSTSFRRSGRGSAMSQRSSSTTSADAIDKLSAALEACDAYGNDPMGSFRTIRCTDDLEEEVAHAQRQSGHLAHSLSSSMMSSARSVSGRSAQTLEASNSSQSGVSRGQHITTRKAEVRVKGWLQRRKGAILRRWKMQYCMLKEDDKMCLYSNEDTVNGKLQNHFQVLRVTFNTKHEAFHVIGVHVVEGTPVKEEFRALRSNDWKLWFQAFRDFFDLSTLGDTLIRLPNGKKLSLHNQDEDIREVEDMILKRSGHGASASQDLGRPSWSSQSAHSNPGVRLTANQDHYLYDSDDGLCLESTRSTLSTYSAASNGTHSHSSRGSTTRGSTNQVTHDDSAAARASNSIVLFNAEDLLSTTDRKSLDNPELDKQVDVEEETKEKDSIATQGPEQEDERPVRSSKAESMASDCPMIERESMMPHGIPLLETRLSASTSTARGSESNLKLCGGTPLPARPAPTAASNNQEEE